MYAHVMPKSIISEPSPKQKNAIDNQSNSFDATKRNQEGVKRERSLSLSTLTTAVAVAPSGLRTRQASGDGSVGAIDSFEDAHGIDQNSDSSARRESDASVGSADFAIVPIIIVSTEC